MLLMECTYIGEYEHNSCGKVRPSCPLVFLSEAERRYAVTRAERTNEHHRRGVRHLSTPGAANAIDNDGLRSLAHYGAAARPPTRPVTVTNERDDS